VEYVRKQILRQTDQEIIDIDEQIEDEIKKGIIPDPNSVDPITGEPLPTEGDDITGMGEMPTEMDMEQDTKSIDMEKQMNKDVKKAEI
jgi:hypothetical protein